MNLRISLAIALLQFHPQKTHIHSDVSVPKHLTAILHVSNISEIIVNIHQSKKMRNLGYFKILMVLFSEK